LVNIALQKKTLLFKQHNKLFANHWKYSTCPTPAFTRIYNVLVKFLTALLMASSRTSPAMPLEFSDIFFGFVDNYSQ